MKRNVLLKSLAVTAAVFGGAAAAQAQETPPPPVPRLVVKVKKWQPPAQNKTAQPNPAQKVEQDSAPNAETTDKNSPETRPRVTEEPNEINSSNEKSDQLKATDTESVEPTNAPVKTESADQKSDSQTNGEQTSAAENQTTQTNAEDSTKLPSVNDSQNVAPENLQGVPSVAPGFRYENKALPDLGRVGVDMLRQLPITLREALELALSNNKDIQLTRQNVRLAEFDFQAARGVYTPRFTGTAQYERSKTPVFSLFGGGSNGAVTQSSVVGNVRYQGFIEKTGASYGFTLSNSRVGTDNLFSLVNPIRTINLGVDFTQPLLRGRRFDQQRRSIEVARKNLTLNDAQFRQKTIEIVATTQRAYWDLFFALRNLQVQRDAVRDAKDQLAHNRRLVEEGVLAPIDVVAAETQVANIEQNVYVGLENVNRAENVLKTLIASDRRADIWVSSLVPTDTVEIEPPVVGVEDALQTALDNRPEVDLNKTQAEINLIDQRFYREQNKPRVDFVSSFTVSGAAGSAVENAINPFSTSTAANAALLARVNQLSVLSNLPPLTLPATTNNQSLPNYLIGGYGDILGSLIRARYNTLRVGVSFDIPLKNTVGNAQIGRSLVEAERLQTQREQIETAIQVDVRNTLQAVRTAEARRRAAVIARQNSEQQYESERRKFNEGQSTFFLVLERQTALTIAKATELNTQTELNKAVAELQRATGNTLRLYNISVRLR